jgi:hypothetical protein
LTGAGISFRKSGKVPVKGLIGNPVRIGSGPAAVIPPFLIKGTFLANMATFPINRNGKAAKKTGKSEDLPEQNRHTSAA